MSKPNVRDYKIANDVIYVRPTLIVGLGGTGVLAMKWVNYLMRQVFGSIPPFVRLLAIDSDVPEEDDGPPLVFPQADFLNLFDYVHLRDVIRDAESRPKLHPHLSDWLNSLDLPSAVVERGCQGLPRLGRVLFFESCFPVIYPAVNTRFERLNEMTLKKAVAEMATPGTFELKGSPVVHIVSSVCGGTGAGMLIDFAYMCRAWSQRMFHRPAEVVAHLMLPEAFHVEIPQTTDKLRGVACSLLRQIEFLMDNRRDHLKVLYPNGTTEIYRRDVAPFSSVYVLNGHGPQGGDQRDELSEMIARTIQAMVLEPVGKEILSDLNNKQLDILSTKDLHTKYPMCFSSYGYRFGTSGAPTQGNGFPWALCDWIGARILELAKPKVITDLLHVAESELTPAQQSQRKSLLVLRDTIARELNPAEFCASMKPGTPAAVGYKVERAPPGSGKDAQRQQAQQNLRKSIETYRDLAKQEYSKYAEERFRERLKRVLDAVDQLIEAQPALEFACAQILTQDFEPLLHRAREQADAEGEFAANFRTEFETRIGSGVKSLLEQQKPPIPVETLLTRDKVIKPVFESAAREAEAKLRRSAAARVFADSLQAATQKEFLAIKKRVDSLPAAAADMSKWKDQAEEHLKERRPKCVSPPTPASHYSSDFLDVEPPPRRIARRCWNESHEVQKKELERLRGYESEFERLTTDVLGWLSKDMRQHPDKQDGRRIRFTDQIELRDRLTSFTKRYYQELLRSLDEEVDRKNPAEHPYFAKMQDFVMRGQPKISINSRGRNTNSFRVVFAQHTEGSSVKDLLEVLEGRKMRSAVVTKDFAATTDNWFQFLQFLFGFCLEGIDTFDEYERALKRYLEPLVLEEDDLWLDPEWMKLYRDYRKKVKEDRQKHEHKQRQRSAAAWDREIGKEFRESVCRFFEGVQGCLSEFEFKVEKDAKEAARVIAEAQANVLANFDRFETGTEKRVETFLKLREDVEEALLADLQNSVLIPRFPLFAAVSGHCFETLRRESEELLTKYDLEIAKKTFVPDDEEADND